MRSTRTRPAAAPARRDPIRLFLAVLALAAGAWATSTCGKETGPITHGTCTNADNTVYAYNLSQQECQTNCPSCTWHQNQ